MKIRGQNGKIVIEEVADKPIIIPSQLYPLSGGLEIFFAGNTEDCEDQQLREIFDSTEASIGHCYSNTENLVSKLKAAGIPKSRYKTYAGWLFIGGNSPIHHAYTVVDNKYMLDFSTNKALEDEAQYHGLSAEETKARVIKIVAESMRKKHSERATFGKVGPLYLYVGSVCKPMQGKQLYQRLMKSHPKHPCFRNITSTGLTDTQNKLLNRLLIENTRS